MIELLKRVSIFEGAAPDLLSEVARSLRPVSVKRGEVVCQMGEPGSCLFLIRNGQVRVSVSEGEDQEVTLGYLGPGDYFGEMSLLTGEPVSANVTATVQTELSALQGERFRALCDENPILYRGICRTLSHRLRETNLRRFETSQGKVSRFITDEPPREPRNILRLLAEIAETIVRDTQKRVLLFLNTTPEKIHNPGFRQDLGCTFVSSECGTTSNNEIRTIIQEIANDFPGHESCWLQTNEGMDVLLWASPWGETDWADERCLNEILARLREVYGHIFVSQLGWTIEAMVRQVPPEDHVVFLVDLRWEACQRRAFHEEYNRYVPEGSRFPPEQGESFWMLTRESLDRITSIERVTVEKLPESRHVHVLLLHEMDRPLLDFPRVRQILATIAVHPIPMISEENLASSGLDEGPSYSITLGRRPRMARNRVARDIAGIKIGLALGGGGARGLAHIGVIKVLEEEGIPLDMLAGSSFGSVVAAAYGVGRSADRLFKDMKYHWGKLGNFLLDIFDYNIPRSALLRGRKIRRMIEIAMADQTIEECPLSVYVVCTDLITGREVVLDKGKLGKAIWASGSLPGIFPPVRWGQYLLVDGAVLNKVPSRILREKGARVVIAVNVTPERDTGLEASHGSPGWVRRCLDQVPPIRRWLSGPNILRIVSRSISVSGLHLSRLHNDVVDVEIKPRIEHFDFLRFEQFEQIVEAGMEATRKALPEIREAISIAGRE